MLLEMTACLLAIPRRKCEKMFTGLIEDIGIIEKLTSRGNYSILTIKSLLVDDSFSIGDSVAIDGACLTAVSIQPGRFVVEASQETLKLTTIDGYMPNTRVNLERALVVGDRLGGHFVSGHIDDRGRVVSSCIEGESIVLTIEFDSGYDNLVAAKGSVAINGVSLTINRVGKGWLNVNLIPHTLANTTLGDLSEDCSVNIEFDLLARYAARDRETRESGNLSMHDLIEKGF